MLSAARDLDVYERIVVMQEVAFDVRTVTLSI